VRRASARASLSTSFACVGSATLICAACWSSSVTSATETSCAAGWSRPIVIVAPWLLPLLALLLLLAQMVPSRSREKYTATSVVDFVPMLAAMRSGRRRE
jgi:hypothetical protein